MSNPIEVAAEALHDQQNDLSDCPYWLTVNNPDLPTEQCGYGCYDEPQCSTCVPSDGWPREALAKRYAHLLPGDDDEPWGPSASVFIDAAAVLEALYADGWRIVRFHRNVVDERTAYNVAEEWKPASGVAAPEGDDRG